MTSSELHEISNMIEIMPEQVNWHSRKVNYLRGAWENLRPHIPKFKLAPFITSEGSLVNPYYKQVVRIPKNRLESEIPLGTVSPQYSLAQHIDVAEMCVKAINKNEFSINNTTCELGLTEFGEWMNFRIIFPGDFELDPGDGHQVKLRLECFNSVEGSSKLQVRISWLRLECLNGMSLGKTKDISDIHNKSLDLDEIENAISDVLRDISRQKELMRQWTTVSLKKPYFDDWVENVIALKWGVKAACRVYYICNSGFDVELTVPFERCSPINKTVNKTVRVPGAPGKAMTYYDVSQALSWIATQRKDAEERLMWQGDIAGLMTELEAFAYFTEHELL